MSGNYIVIQAGVDKDKRAAGGVMLYIHKSYESSIDHYNIWSERIVSVRMKTKGNYLTMIAVYAPEEGKTELSKEFYETLQRAVQRINPREDVVIAGDLNAKVGRVKISKTVGTNGAGEVNSNGRMLIDFCVYHNLRILNTFFKQKECHKYTWSSRGLTSIIDYVIARESVAKQCINTRVYRGYEIGSDHYLLQATIKVSPTKREKTKQEKRTKIRSIDDPVNKWLYQKRVQATNQSHPVSNNSEKEWENIKTVILQAANESLGTVSGYRKMARLRIWDDEVKTLIDRKWHAFRKWMKTKKQEDLIEFRRQQALAKRKIRQLKRKSWENFVANLEHDVYKLRPKTYKIIRRLDANFTEKIRLPKVEAKEAVKYFTDLWTAENEIDWCASALEENEADAFTIEDLKKALKNMKNGKAPGCDGISAELFKYATIEVQKRLLNFLNKICREGRLPEDLTKAIVTPIFKKGDLSKMENYRGISLLCVAYKILAKMIARKLTDLVDESLLECQNGFRKGRSCTDATYTIKLIMEKRIEFNKQTHICFVDFEKAYDKVDRTRLFEILNKRSVPKNLIQALKAMYSGTKIQVRLENETSECAQINGGVRQGCPASCVLFNIYIDEIMRKWYETNPKGVKLDQERHLEAVLFADDLAILAEDEDNLQRALYKLNAIAKEYNMKVSTGKTKVMAFYGKEPIRSKIVIDGKPIEQVNGFKYLGNEISYLGEVDVEKKITKFLKVSGLINRILPANCIRRETRLKVYNTLAIPMLTYGSEAWVLRKKDKQRISAAEMKFLRKTAGYTLLDRKRNESIQNELKITPVVRRVKEYRRRWREHVHRMEEERSPKLAQKYTPTGKRDRGRPRRKLVDTSASSETDATPQTGH